MKYLILSALLFTVGIVVGQTELDNALISIAKNNKSLASSQKYVETKQLENRTGLRPENPFISADYLIGRPVAGGNQLDFQVAQGFDFPSVYGKRGNLADQQNILLETELKDLRQTILLEAKLLIIEIIHLNQRIKVIEERRNQAQQIVQTYQVRFDAEDISALELNKAKIQLLTVKSQVRSIASLINVKMEHLAELNGGIPIAITENTYPLDEAIPDFETLEDTIEHNDPQLEILYQQAVVSESRLALTKAMTLPKFEVGYHYQSVLGQTFNGVHFGLSIPLWEHKNKKETERARVVMTKMQIDEHETEHYYEIKEMYRTYENLKKELKEYRTVINELNSEEILQKSLELGEINFIVYSGELNFYYNAYDQVSEIEKEYHMAIAKLYKYQL